MKFFFFAFFAFMAIYTRAQNNFMTLQPSLGIEIATQPTVLKVRGGYTLSYELHIFNFSSSPFDLASVSVVDGKDSAVLVKFTGSEILNRLYRPGAKVSENTLAPGSFQIFYVDFDAGQKSPGKIFHEVAFSDAGNNVFSVRSAESKARTALDVIGSPLRGGPWAAVFSPTWPRGHRRVIFTVDGQARIPGRFAIDFIKLDQDGRMAKGDQDSISSWYGYGTEVLAIADGTIASTRDDFFESPTLSGHPDYDATKATGNYVSLRLASGNVAFYEHLKPGSVRVRPGQHVRKGEVIARLGFTGQSTGPHLHFHIADRDSPLGAEGLPFTFEKFRLLGNYRDFAEFGKTPWTPVLVDVRNEFPESNTVIAFGEIRK